MTAPFRALWATLLATAAIASACPPSAAAPLAPAARTVDRLGRGEGSIIVATVNGEVISRGDVDNRRRLFALSVGLPVTPEVLSRLTSQVTTQLIDEKLKLRELQRRNIVVTDQEIAAAIAEIEQRNGMPTGTLQRRLAADGVSMRTMIDQIRVQIGWGRVLREAMGAMGAISAADIAQREEALKAQIGQMEYNIGEIFVPVTNPARIDEARRFAETILQPLRAGAPFPLVAAQFSQSQSALQGGSRGWVQAIELDPEVVRILNEMPPGAISNPIPVAGGLEIVTLRAKRQIGREQAVMVSPRQVFFRFTEKLNPQQPTEQQKAAIEQARKLGATAHSCADMEAAARAAGNEKDGNPGEVRLDAVAIPALRQLMATLPIEKASEPLIADDGVAVMMVCSRENRTLELPDKRAIAESLVAERAELLSRQMLRDLQRKARIERRL